MVPPLDECKFCVREFWEPWLQQLLDIEDEARVVERKATFAARDALSKSERDLALNLRLYASDAVLSIRDAKKDVMKAIAAIEAEKAKRKSIDKEKYGIQIKCSNANTHYKEAMAKAFKSKQLQEHKFKIMELWCERWAEREADAEEDEPKQKPLTSLLKPPEDAARPRLSRDLTDDDHIASDEFFQSSHKPALKKKEDRHDSDAAQKDIGGAYRSKIRMKQSKEKLTSPSSHFRPKSAGMRSQSALLKATPDKKAVAPPDKGVVIKEEPTSTEVQERSTLDKEKAKEPGQTPNADKATIENKESSPLQSRNEKPDLEKKEPANAPDKATNEKKEATPVATPLDKKTEPSNPPTSPNPEKKP